MSIKPSANAAAGRDVIDGEVAEPEGGALFGQEVDARQLDLLRGGDGHLPSNIFRLVRAEPERLRKPGRPKGARNKRSTNLAARLQAKYSDPVEFQASIYDMPLDQMCEMLLIADGTIERREVLEDLLHSLAERVDSIGKHAQQLLGPEDYRQLTKACDALADAAGKLQGKPGDLAMKALNLQLAAAKSVSEYWHSKKPVEAKVEFSNVPTIVMPGMAAAGPVDFNQQDQATRFAGDLLAKALQQGRIEAQDIVGLQLVDGQLVVDGEFVEVDQSGEVSDE